MVKRALLVTALLVALALSAQAQAALILVVGDLDNPPATVVESRLREQLRKLRDQGLALKLASYNFAVSAHRPPLKRLGLNRSAAPILAVCEVDSQGVPSKVLFFESVRSPEESLGHMKSFLGLDAPVPGPGPGTGPGELTLDSVDVHTGNVLGVLNVKVRLRNPGASTASGPFLIRLGIRPQGEGNWQLVAEQTLDKVPAGHNVVRDFVPHDLAELIAQPFQVRVEVVFQGATLLDREVSHPGAGAQP